MELPGPIPNASVSASDSGWVDVTEPRDGLGHEEADEPNEVWDEMRRMTRTRFELV